MIKFNDNDKMMKPVNTKIHVTLIIMIIMLMFKLNHSKITRNGNKISQFHSSVVGVRQNSSSQQK